MRRGLFWSLRRFGPEACRDLVLQTMRIAIYFVAVATLTGIAWQYPFLFELPLIAAIGGAYWAFFSGKGGKTDTSVDER